MAELGSPIGGRGYQRARAIGARPVLRAPWHRRFTARRLTARPSPSHARVTARRSPPVSPCAFHRGA